MSKVSVIGAGNVGATCANSLAHMKFVSDVVLLDVREGFAEGKAIDMMQSIKMFDFTTKIQGVTNNYEATENSDVVVITSGMPRKPGMSREDLIETNAKIILDVLGNVVKHSPNAVIIMVANPMDTMTYLAVKKSGLMSHKIIGMGGMLDSCRFNYYLSEALGVPACDVHGLVIGGHGDTTMVPLMSRASYKGGKISKRISDEESNKVVEDTLKGGATLTKLIGTSAWYAPGAAAAALARAVVMDERRVYPCCVYIDGEYEENDICIGVPAVIGKDGIEEVIELELTNSEYARFKNSIESVRKVNSLLSQLGYI